MCNLDLGLGWFCQIAECSTFNVVHENSRLNKVIFFDFL